MKNPVVAVALSGGVDSLVSGYLIKQKYKDVFGIHFTTGYEKEQTNLSLLESQLGFPVTGIDLSKSFEEKVIQYFIQTYLQGRTPNPCVICNKEIKFGQLLGHAQKMGADFLATGHYATIVNPISFPDREISQSYLEKGRDPLKDQSYFLSLLSGDQLEKIIFPLAGMRKEAVKRFAGSKQIAPIHPGESQDICFIHDKNFSEFIIEKQKMIPEPGNIIDMNGEIVGQHKGLHRFTVGQRRGIDCPAKEPYYVRKLDIKKNTLHVCFKKDLSQKKFIVDQINWNFPDLKIIPDIMTKIRYSHKGAGSTLTLKKYGNETTASGTEKSNRPKELSRETEFTCREKLIGEVVFDEPQNAVTPGQAAVFYKGPRVLGAGIIQ